MTVSDTPCPSRHHTKRPRHGMQSCSLSDMLATQDAVPRPISPRLPSTPLCHRSQVRTSHSSSCSPPPLPFAAALYISLRSVARLIGAINTVPLVFCPVSSTTTSDSQPGGTVHDHPSFKHCCPTYRDVLPPPASRTLGRSCCGRRALPRSHIAALRLLARTACTPPPRRRTALLPLR